LGTGIFNSDGDAWKLQWKVASYEFNTHSIQNFVLPVVEAVMDRLLPILEEASERGSFLDLQDLLQHFMFDNICKVSFGVDPDFLDQSLPVSEFSQDFNVATELSARRSTAPISLVWKIKRMLNVGLERRLSQVVEVVHDFEVSCPLSQFSYSQVSCPTLTHLVKQLLHVTPCSCCMLSHREM
jgi:hypothetical protein